MNSYLFNEIQGKNEKIQNVNFMSKSNNISYKNIDLNSHMVNEGLNYKNNSVNIINNDNNYSFCNYNPLMNSNNNGINNNINNLNNIINNNSLQKHQQSQNINASYNFINNINYNKGNIFNKLYLNNININFINISENYSSTKNKNSNILYYNHYKRHKITLNEFIIYINNIKISLIDFICNSKEALELQEIIINSGNDIKLYLVKILKREGLIIIMKNIHGNYFFQNLIKNSSNKIITNIISYIIEDFIDISKDDSGTFSIQALLDEVLSINDINKILKIIKGKEIEMIYDKNATYVIQKIILKFPDIYRNDLNEIILQNMIQLCLNVNGICLVKNFIKTNTIEKDKRLMNNIITNNLILLAKSPFGNYAIQFLIEKLNRNELKEIFEIVNNNIFKLSIQQYSSNVVEKALEKMDELNRQESIEKLFFQDKFLILLKNKYAKFIITNSVKYMSNELKNKFECNMVNNINNGLYNNKDRKRIIKFLEKYINNKSYVNNK